MPLKTKFNRKEIGDIIENDVGSKYKIVGLKTRKKMNTDKKYKQRSIYYQLQCLKCGFVFWIREEHVKNRRCYCEHNNRPRVVQGINDIPTVAPWMIKYFLGGYEEAKKYSVKSNKKVVLKCPNCGKLTKPTYVYDLERNNGIRCVCSDTISYPEKFMSALLNQLNIEYDFQVGKRLFNFLDKNYRYDFYIPKYDCIIETHGEQHYSENSFYSKLRDQQKNDFIKKSLAIENGIKNYIIIDCRNSNRNWIKDSIMNSDLPSILSFSIDDIDWLKCEEYCMSNITKEICDYYMKTMYSTVKIGEKFHYGHNFVMRCLLRGHDFGWCIYKTSKGHPKPIKLISDNKTMLFTGALELEKRSNELFNERVDHKTMKEYKDKDKKFHGYYIQTVTDTKEKFIAIYGDEAVKWFEEHPEFNS